MGEQTYKHDFNGYWKESDKSKLPSISGVYCVYECTHNSTENSVSIHRLIYIGESDNINARIAGHEKLPFWERFVRHGNELCYSYTEVSASDRYRVEAAFINHHQPLVNIEYKDSFTFDKTTILTSGRSALLERIFCSE